ncbi:TRAFAC clade GTPase domain-containing protein [Burkholderia sp. LMU1-1-1.1]|uniref:TRAFAC clade GTPase domain-containing protein n=1 Tax=Burkholderia sp. LMU1-1-1.1 TaxID=3135266 RepID=UPI00344029E0
MTTESLQRRCNRDGCNPESGGGCIDGLSADDCPNRYEFAAIDEVLEAGVPSPSAPPSEIELPPGVRQVHNGVGLSEIEVNRHLRRHGGLVISFIGCPDAGKTTIAAMLYELMKRRRLGQIGFVGSKTLRGFQSRSFYSQFESGLSVPVTERTKKSLPIEYLHLRASFDVSKKTHFDIFMADRSGEEFEDCIKMPKFAENFPEIYRADCHVLLLDGRKLINPELAASHIGEIRRIVLALLQFSGLGQSQKIQVVLTKLDEVIVSSRKEQVEEIFDHFVSEVKSRVVGDITISAHKLAARPNQGEFYLGEGLETLMREWIPIPATRTFSMDFVSVDSGSHYDYLINAINR